MDEEDLADAEEARKIQTSASFAGLGSTDSDAVRASGLLGLFRVQGETMGVKLLRRMGWKEGQGIGPKVRRTAFLDMRTAAAGSGETFLFAPEDVSMVAFVRKQDRKGLGYEGESRIGPLNVSGARWRSGEDDDDDEEDEEDEDSALGRPRFTIGTGIAKKKGAKAKGGIGIGILNDTGSDDDDPYEMGPRISYNRVIGGGRKKKKATIAVNPALKNKPTFIPKKKALAGIALGVRKCHDGKLPLDGFVFGKDPDSLTSSITSEGKYPPPKIPPGWKSSKQPASQLSATTSSEAPYVSTADAAKSSALDPKARAALLGEKQLPGKSVFDFMSESAREQLSKATGRTDLPAARGEVPAGYALSEEERLQQLLDQVPKLEKPTAIAAISRGSGGGAPYADNEDKRSRYRGYLEYQAGFSKELPPKPYTMKQEDWLREFHEFFNCARIFKPMTGVMASRFTTSSSSTKVLSSGSPGVADEKELLSKPPPRPQDPAEEAARLGMFGHLTRSTADFFPTRLLCKRFNVKAPSHVQPDQDQPGGDGLRQETFPTRFASSAGSFAMPQDPSSGTRGQSNAHESGAPNAAIAPAVGVSNPVIPPQEPVMDASRNEALEGTRAGEDVFKAIFGDSDEDDEE